MKKNAIIDIISNDIADIQLLLSTFKGADNIPAAFLEMLHTKYEALGKEIALLDFWQTPDVVPQTPKPVVAEVKAEAPQAEVKPVEEVKPEPVVEVKPEVVEEPQPEPVKFEIPRVVMPEPIIGVPTDEPKAEPVAEVKVEPKVEAEPEPVAEVKAEPKVEAKAEPRPAPKPAPAAHVASASDIRAYGTPVDRVSRAFSINDRILYQKELFGANNALFTSVLEAIDNMASFDEARTYLLSAFPQWDEQETIVAEFFRTIHRRFI